MRRSVVQRTILVGWFKSGFHQIIPKGGIVGIDDVVVGTLVDG